MKERASKDNIMPNRKINAQRNYGIDLLRLLAMYLVVVVHVSGQFAYKFAPKGSLNFNIAWGTFLSSLIAVNVFVMITGFVCVNSHHSWKSLIKLWSLILFYSLGIGVVVHFPFPSFLSTKEFIRCFFPIIQKHYWYCTAYVGLFVMMPLWDIILDYPFSDKKNGIIDDNKKHFLFKSLLTIAVVFTIFPSLSFGNGRECWGVADGFNVFWFSICYLTGGYIKRFGLYEYYTLTKLCIAYLLTAFAFCCWFAFSHIILGQKGFMVNYTLLPLYLQALFLLLIFKRLSISKWLCTALKIVTPSVFSVYLIHMHWGIRNIIVSLPYWQTISKLPCFLFVLSLFIIPSWIFVMCLLIDLVRRSVLQVLQTTNKQPD